jgi:UDP-N-acetylmuramate dehydrogenase
VGPFYFNVKEILENVPLAPLTTLQIGGPARYFVEATTVEEVLFGLEFARSMGLKIFILGGGSNLLISDSGIDGLVIRVAIDGIEFENPQGGELRVRAGAGMIWDDLVNKCVSRGLAGFECLSGIPGLVGGSPVQNIGAYGQEVSDTVVSVRCLDVLSGDIVELNRANCKFSYRSSIFNGEFSGRYVVLSVTYSLATEGKPKIVYKDLVNYFAGRTPTLQEVRDAVVEIRRAKSMVIDPHDENSRSAGSFFKNPIVTHAEFEDLKLRFGEIPSFAFGDLMKIPAAWLIEHSGFKKGHIMRNVGLSQNHTLAIINRGNGTAVEVIGLMRRIQSDVSKRFGIELMPEPIFVGF